MFSQFKRIGLQKPVIGIRRINNLISRFALVILGLIFSLSAMSSLALANPLPERDVFELSAGTIDPNTFVLNWNIKPGYFLYSERIKLDNTNELVANLGALRMPKALFKIDKLGKRYAIYRDNLTIPVAVLGVHAGEVLLKLRYQGCSDKGYCYPPVTRTVKVSLDNDLALSAVSIEAFDELVAASKTQKVIDADGPSNEIDKILAQSHWFVTLMTFFGLGLLLAFTPCVLPMVPVLSGLIVGHAATLSTRRAFLLSLSYVLGMSFTYALIGAVVASLGHNLQLIMQSPWVISCFSVIFVLLALSMFGLYDLKLPQSMQQKLAEFSRSHATGHYMGAALMGALSILILSPCVSPPLIAVLSYIAETGQLFLGSVALFFLGLGMGTPLLIVGVSAGKWLPKAGAWMNAVKTFFGLLMLAVAVYLMGRILAPALTMVLWASLFVMSGIFVGVFEQAQTAHTKLAKGLGILLLSYGLLILLGASFGNDNPLMPLENMQPSAKVSETKTSLVVKTIQETDMAIAKASGKPVMLDFYASWCASCKVLEATTLKDPSILTLLENFVVLKVDVTANDAQTKAMLSRYKVLAPPTFVFLSATGKLLNKRLVGDVSVDHFQETLTKVATALK